MTVHELFHVPALDCPEELAQIERGLRRLEGVGAVSADYVGRVLRVGGLLSFTTLGPDTLKEIRTSFAGLDRHTHVNRFIDMHDVGDMLVRAGFANPVMDMEYLTLTYADAGAMMRELKALELIYEKSLYPELAYMFKHALTQEVTYGSLLLKRRKELHRLIGLSFSVCRTSTERSPPRD